MREIMAVFIGGGLGCLLRYGLSKAFNPLLAWVPLGTFLSNMLACGIMGMVVVWLQVRSGVPPYASQLLLAGFCGGFSTFSTFSMENFRLLEQDQWGAFLLYLGGSIVLGLAGIYGGLLLGKKMF